MEKERGSKIIAIVALVVAVLGLSVGFAAYSRNLDITTLEGTVTVDETELDVFFDNDQTKGNELAVVKGEGSASVADEAGAEITNPQLNSTTSPTISGFQANFSAKGDKVTYTFYVYNNSSLNAYLEAVDFIGTNQDHKVCVALDEADSTNVSNACKDITMSLKIGGDTILSTGTSEFQTHTIAPGAWQEVVVELAYDGTNYSLPDGDMKVTFDGMRLSYTTLAQTQQ